MKIRVELDNEVKENEVIIKCNELNEEVRNIQIVLGELLSQKKHITFYKGETEYYLSLEEILFFETEESGICAHTINNIYNVKYKLYELEELLPGYFMRVSKSTILNTNHIYSITKSISSSSRVEFQNTHKQVYVSRYYYKPLKIKLLEKRK
ncbi:MULTISPECIES: LytTR family DNA-binding domain-containing protein [Clostridium]|jgi:Response regulator of the LytR/AlgR family|uniref:LytTR family transcriptional regulator n=2 Tax=Clostridium beijerinckii TaxID=1520 RepID=A0AAE2RRG8_CLOBE|nr:MULTISPECIES: LytTR family DNA-binding domain-containing protein [Clostridium]ABR35173.1 response regulator receiver protein [Clostridium beijerinckii NCIMB 8052]AIU02734.1 response regulator receiver protein [Clostridium beijerinckii ATCC 35702]ALB45783.1 LytTR family transcriptional regulator [Clostridium beijerinckii NRRL B-598]MBF7810193.1 LytTR family transcriptional regulator [Clostridium beijerinckii]MCI1578718.1 LytTR family transcriptional regulator [Clostridium beijerinckii]